LRKFILGLVLIVCFQYSFSEKPKSEIIHFPDETVDFSLKYGIFKIGEAHLQFSTDQKYSCANIHAEAQSTGLLKLFKNIRFRYECSMDILTGLPISDSRILIEDDYVDISTVYYDHTSRKDSSLIYSQKTDTVVVPKNIYDILSGFYHYRANYLGDNLPLNHTVSTTTFFIDKIWDFKIRYCGKDIINTNYGPLECLKVKPLTIVGHFFQTSDAMTVWFTNNGKYIPIKFTIDLKKGTLYGDITDYKSNNAINKMK
jgi:hypothetical protein